MNLIWFIFDLIIEAHVILISHLGQSFLLQIVGIYPTQITEPSREMQFFA